MPALHPIRKRGGGEFPSVFVEQFGSAEQGQRRGGIHVHDMRLTVPLEAEQR